MSSNAEVSAGRKPWEIKIDKIVKHPDARKAFEKLCQEGCDREWLAARILGLRGDKPSRSRKSFVNRTECRRLSKTFTRLAREFEDLRVIAWCHARRKPQPATDFKPLRLIINGFVFQPQPHVEFDVNILRDQLRAAADYFGQLGKKHRPVPLYLEVNDFHLQRLLTCVKEQTGKAHYNEVAWLCEAATGRHAQGALKQRAYRARSGKRTP